MAETTNTTLAWWKDDLPTERHNVAWTAIDTLRSLQSDRISAGQLYESMYEQRNPYLSDSASFVGGMAGDFGWVSQSDEIQLITYNAMQIGFDTLVSKLMQADPRVVCQTDNGNFETRKKAELLERIIFSEFNKLDFYEIKEECSIDMLLFGFGEMRFDIDEDAKCARLRRVHPLDVFYDVLEARDEPPLTRYEVRLTTKDALKAEYDGFDAEIDAATVGDRREAYTQRGMNPDQMVELVEAIRLPLPGEKAGKRILFIQTATLFEEKWKHKEFPVVRMHWTKRRRGPYPIPAAEQIVFIQRNLNRLIQRKHECIYTMATPKLILDEHTGVPPSAFTTSGVSDIIMGNFSGSPAPSIMNPSVVPADIEQAINQDKQDIANILGINSLQSIGVKPAGLDSQPGLAEYNDISDLRHYKTLKENERFVVKAAKMLLETLRECVKRYGQYAVLTEAMGDYETIDFSDADLPPSELRINLAPANMLPATPAGRLNRIVQLAGTGAFSTKQVIRMFNSPDVSAAVNDITAGEQEIEWSIYEMTKPNGKYYEPTEHCDLTMGIEKVNAAWERCRRQGYPESVLGRLDRWLAEALLLQQQQQAAMMAQQVQAQQAQQMQQQGIQTAQAMGGMGGDPNQAGQGAPAPGEGGIQ